MIVVRYVTYESDKCANAREEKGLNKLLANYSECRTSFSVEKFKSHAENRDEESETFH